MKKLLALLLALLCVAGCGPQRRFSEWQEIAYAEGYRNAVDSLRIVYAGVPDTMLYLPIGEKPVEWVEPDTLTIHLGPIGAWRDSTSWFLFSRNTRVFLRWDAAPMSDRGRR